MFLGRVRVRGGVLGRGLGRGPGREVGIIAGRGVDGAAVAEIPVSGLGGDSGGTLGAVDIQQDIVAIDGFGEGGVAGDGWPVRGGVGGLAGVQGKPVSPAAVVQDRTGGGRDCLVAAEDVHQGVVTKAVAAVVVFIIGFEEEGAVFLPVTVGVPGVWGRLDGVFGRVEIVGTMFRGRDEIAGVILRGRGVEAAAQEFFGGGQPMVGFEVLEAALHHINQEADGGAAVASLLADQSREVPVERGGIKMDDRRRRGQTLGRLGRVSRGGIGGDEGVGREETEVEELTGGIKAMARLGIFQAALHEVDEEADDEPAVAGLFADDVSEGRGEGFRGRLPGI